MCLTFRACHGKLYLYPISCHWFVLRDEAATPAPVLDDKGRTGQPSEKRTDPSSCLAVAQDIGTVE